MDVLPEEYEHNKRGPHCLHTIASHVSKQTAELYERLHFFHDFRVDRISLEYFGKFNRRGRIIAVVHFFRGQKTYEIRMNEVDNYDLKQNEYGSFGFDLLFVYVEYKDTKFHVRFYTSENMDFQCTARHFIIRPCGDTRQPSAERG